MPKPSGNNARSFLASLARWFSLRLADGDSFSRLEQQRQALLQAIDQLDLDQTRRLLELAERLLAAATSDSTDRNLLASAEMSADGTAYETVVRKARGLAQAVASARTSIERLAPYRELAWLKESIAWHATRRFPGLCGGTSIQERLRDAARALKYADR